MAASSGSTHCHRKPHFARHLIVPSHFNDLLIACVRSRLLPSELNSSPLFPPSSQAWNGTSLRLENSSITTLNLLGIPFLTLMSEVPVRKDIKCAAKAPINRIKLVISDFHLSAGKWLTGRSAKSA